MKTPEQWLAIFTAEDRSYDRDAALQNIKEVQDEAFEAGLEAAREISMIARTISLDAPETLRQPQT